MEQLASGHGHAFLAKKHRCRQHQNGCVHEEGHGKSDNGIEGIELDGAPNGGDVLLKLAALHQS